MKEEMSLVVVVVSERVSERVRECDCRRRLQVQWRDIMAGLKLLALALALGAHG
jgi:hypothetical protein